jgi:hypothetical protein
LLDDEVVKKIRRLQAKLIIETDGSVSLSSIINRVLKENL